MDTFILDQDKLIGLETKFLFKISLREIRDQYVMGIRKFVFIQRDSLKILQKIGYYCRLQFVLCLASHHEHHRGWPHHSLLDGLQETISWWRLMIIIINKSGRPHQYFADTYWGQSFSAYKTFSYNWSSSSRPSQLSHYSIIRNLETRGL